MAKDEDVWTAVIHTTKTIKCQYPVINILLQKMLRIDTHYLAH